MTSKRYNTTEQTIALDSPIRVRKLHRHTRGAKPYHMSRRAVEREKRRKNKFSQQDEHQSDTYPEKDKQANPSNKRNAHQKAKGVLPMNEHQPKSKSAISEALDQLVDMHIEVSLFTVVREYPEQVKAVICRIFDQSVQAKNPLLAFINSLMVAMRGKYTFNTMTKKIAFTTDLSALDNVTLKALINPQKVKYTPARASQIAFINRWLTKGMITNAEEEGDENQQ